MNSDLTLLGIREGFSQSELRAAYRARVRLVHPDLATSDSDRVRRTRETIRVNLAYAELRRAPVRMTPQSVPPPVVQMPTVVGFTPTNRPTFSAARDSILALAGAIVAGLAASTITGQLPLTVGVMLVGTAGARWAHGHPDQNLRREPG